MSSEPSSARPLPTPPSGVSIHGHRGARAREPENTLPAFRHALAVGADVLELDLHVTRDDVLVVWHDARFTPELVRAPDGGPLAAPVLLRAHDYATLATYELGCASNPRFPAQATRPGTRLARLDEVLALVASSTRAVGLNVELKAVPGRPDETPPAEAYVALLARALEAHPVLLRRTIVQSFDHRLLREARRRLRGVAISALVEDTYLDHVALARGLGADWVSPNHLWIDRPMVEALHAAGVRVAVWTVNDDADLDRVVAMGVDAIITDDPERTRARLAARR
jgi:glycerophosphoryl diester phosphodiesterase